MNAASRRCSIDTLSTSFIFSSLPTRNEANNPMRSPRKLCWGKRACWRIRLVISYGLLFTDGATLHRKRDVHAAASTVYWSEILYIEIDWWLRSWDDVPSPCRFTVYAQFWRVEVRRSIDGLTPPLCLNSMLECFHVANCLLTYARTDRPIYSALVGYQFLSWVVFKQTAHRDQQVTRTSRSRCRGHNSHVCLLAGWWSRSRTDQVNQAGS